jgi:hypothetical protein
MEARMTFSILLAAAVSTLARAHDDIPVELRVELDGPGTHREAIGGNYRARGRADNFLHPAGLLQG